MNNQKRIGAIGNYYGDLQVATEDGKFFWSIENWDGHNWNEIPESLYKALVEYETAREASE